MTIIHKTTTEKVGPGFEYVLSDATVDRYGDSIDPKGWATTNFKRNPIALFNHDSRFPIGKWTNVRVDDAKLLGKLRLAEPGTSERIDEIIALIRQGILKAVSVGFKALEREPMADNSGIFYKRQELLEASVVSVPANPAAVQVARSLGVSDETISLAFGEHAEGRKRTTGEHADIPRSIKAKSMSTLAERIKEAQDAINADRDTLNEQVKEAEPDQDMIDELSRRIEENTERMASLQRAEKALATKAITTVEAPAVQRKPFGVKAKEVTPLDLFIRRAVVHIESALTGKDFDKVLEKRYPDRDEATDVICKAAIAGATTTTAGWAAELVNTSTAAFLESLEARSIYPALASRGLRLTFNNQNGAIRIPSRASTPSIAGSFVGEGAPIPVRRIGLTSLTISPKKMAVISVFSREIGRYSTPAIEGLLRQEIVADTAATIDSLLLDAVAGSAVRPAGLLNGLVTLTPTAGGGSAAMLGDFAKLLAPFDTANAADRDIVLIMHPARARALRWTPGPDGTFGWPSEILGELTILTSTSVPATTVIAVAADDFVTAAGDTPEFDLSDSAILHMEDTTPGQITTGAAAVSHPSQSMFQTAQIAIRMLLDITWGMRRTGMVQFITPVTW